MKIIAIIFISMALTNFFGATSISNSILLVTLVPFILLEINEKTVFKPYIFVLLIGLFLSMISSNFFRDQSIMEGFKASVNFFYIMFYFMLRRINPSTIQMESALITLVIIFCISYIMQFILYPMVIFSGSEEEFSEDIRIRLMAQGFSSLGYFWGLNNLLIGKKRIIGLLLSIMCVGVIFLMGFRTMLAGIALFTFIMALRVYGFSWKIFITGFLASGVFIAILQFPLFAEKLNIMLERQETQNFSNSDYIRVVQFQYFTQHHFKSTIEYFLGSGMPFEGTRYGNYMRKLTDEGIYYVDWGLIGISWIVGLISVFAMISYSIKAFSLKVKKEHYYIGIWFLYLIVTSITTMEFYRPGNFVVQAIALFMVEKVYVTDKYKISVKQKNRIIF
ncbi:MAG: hypothetical protein WD398_11225 [Cyclobacteriaceae bacterium]